MTSISDVYGAYPDHVMVGSHICICSVGLLSSSDITPSTLHNNEGRGGTGCLFRSSDSSCRNLRPVMAEDGRGRE